MINKTLTIDEHIVLASALNTAQELVSRLCDETRKKDGLDNLLKSINLLGVINIRCEEAMWRSHPRAGLNIYRKSQTWQQIASEDLAWAKYRLDKASKIAQEVNGVTVKMRELGVLP